MAATGLQPFLDIDGRLRRWPAKRRRQLEALTLIAGHFDTGRTYTEADVNALLDSLHTFGDAAGIRRALCDWGYLGRERDGSTYWLITSDPPFLSDANPASARD